MILRNKIRYDNKINKSVRYVFGTQLNIYRGVFLAKIVNVFCKKATSQTDDWVLNTPFFTV